VFGLICDVTHEHPFPASMSGFFNLPIKYLCDINTSRSAVFGSFQICVLIYQYKDLIAYELTSPVIVLCIIMYLLIMSFISVGMGMLQT
jgi:hypothetical protein